MEVHQTFRFVFGLIVAGAGLLCLFGILYECLKTKALPVPARQPLVSGILFIALGAADLSRAFDWPYHESNRTSLVELVSLPVLFAGIVLLFLLKRAEKKATAGVGTTTPGEHTT